MAKQFRITESMSFEDVEKAIGLLAKRSASLRDDVQKCLFSVTVQWHKSGNAAHAAKLFARITTEVEGYYGTAITQYLNAFLGLEWNGKDAYKYTQTKVSEDVAKAMKAKPFYLFSPPPVPKAFDDVADLQKFLAKAVKHYKDVQEGKAPEGSKPMPVDLYKKLSAVLAEYKAEEQAA